MKTVLIIGADFSPSSLPPATRIRFFANHLPEFGWEPLILTTKPDFYESSPDPENGRLLSKSLVVIRTDALRHSWTRKIGVGDLGIRSLWHHWRAVKKICRERKVDLIFIPVPPYVPMLLGRLAHRRFGIPYVIDYIDPWVTEYYWRLPKSQRPPKWVLAYGLSRALEPFSLKNVAHITGVSQGTTASVLARYPWLAPADATAIPYGAENSDFDYIREHPRANTIFNRNDGRLHISYVGACIPGMHDAVRALFQAVKLGLERRPKLFELIQLHFVGTSYSASDEGQHDVVRIAGECGIAGHVDEHRNRVPYLDSLQIMLDSHGLVVVGSDEPHYTASKIFPYILAQRPLLAIFHEESSVIRIVSETHSGSVVTFNSEQPATSQAEQISACVEQMLLAANDHSATTRWEAFQPYSTKAMTGVLAAIFDSVVGEESEDGVQSFKSSSVSVLSGERSLQ